MQQIFLTEEITTSKSTPIKTATTLALCASQNNVVLYTSDYIPAKRGMLLEIGLVKYPIESFLFDSLSLTYKVTVTGGLAPFPRGFETWRVFDVDRVVNSILLDSEDVDIATVYTVADIADLATRKDTITKNIVLKGTDVNNRAFGHMFFFARNTDMRIPNRLFFNYSPIRAVDCVIYENSFPLLRGQMIITQINVDGNGGVIYNATITGNFVGFKSTLGDRKLTDLDLGDMEHDYGILAILDSWGAKTTGSDTIGNSRTYWVDQVTGTPYFKPFALGTGYVYPTIDYGEKFQNPDYNGAYTRFKVQNYRPAVYVKEYFERIFASAGYTWELRADMDLMNRFNRAIIPDAGEVLGGVQAGTAASYAANDTYNLQTGAISPVTAYNKLGYFFVNPGSAGLWHSYIPLRNAINNRVLDFDNQLYPNTDIYGTTPPANRTNVLLRVKKNFRASARVRATGTLSQPATGNPGQFFYIQLLRRARRADTANDTYSTVQDFEVLAQQGFSCPVSASVNFNVDFIVPEMDYEQSQQLVLCMAWDTFNNEFSSTLLTASVVFPKDAGALFTVEVGVGDKIKPVAPDNVLQFDFIRSIASLFNLYIFNNKDRDKHLIFQTYDDYYALADPVSRTATALDWTRKIDYSKGQVIKSNLSIPKKYLFTYKDDADFLNTQHKQKYGLAYGAFRFTDAYGFTDEKRVEVIFSPTPPVVINGLDRMIPIITKDGIDLVKKNKMKSNIRILFYSGVFYTTGGVTVGADSWDNTAPGRWTFDPVFGVDWYALASSYLFDPYNDIFHPATSKTTALVPTASLDFGNPGEFYFNVTAAYLSLPNSYTYYRAQITELTDSNLFVLEINAALNVIDAANINLRTPIYISAGEQGAAYFKVLSITYQDEKTVTSLTLQKIK